MKEIPRIIIIIIIIIMFYSFIKYTFLLSNPNSQLFQNFSKDIYEITLYGRRLYALFFVHKTFSPENK